MTSAPFSDSVAIDTNVFQHLLNPKNNCDLHIHRLLVHLQHFGVCLILDNKGRIFGEYSSQIAPILLRTDDTRNEIYMLRYWIHHAPRHTVEIDLRDRLMTLIERVIIERREIVDKSFVYVALRSGKILITNDGEHILYGPRHIRKPASRRDALLRSTRKARPAGAEILTSEEAHGRIP